MRGGMVGIDRGQRDVANHERAVRVRQHVAERQPVRGFQLPDRRIEVGPEMMRVRAHAADARKMLQRRTDAGGLQSAYISAGDRADDHRISCNRALANQRMEIEAVTPCWWLEIEHRREIEVDAEIGELPAVDTAELFRSSLLVIRS